MHRFSNNAIYTLTAGIDSSEMQLSMVADGDSTFNVPYTPDGTFQAATLYDPTMPGVYEIVHIFSVDGEYQYLAVRGAEGAARAWPAGTKVAARVTAGMLSSFLQGTQEEDAAGETSKMYAGVYGYVHTLRGVSLNAPVYANDTWAIAGVPALQRFETPPYGMSFRSVGAESIIATRTVNLGVVPAWAAATGYSDQSVVRPTTPDGYQYAISDPDYPENPVLTSGGSEPIWAASVAFDAAYPGVEWVRVDLTTGVDLSFGSDVLFLPTEVGFICTGYGGSVSAAPYITVESADAGGGALVTNQQITITGAKQWHRFTSVPNEGMHAIRFKLNTAATGDIFMGRFYAKGVFVVV